MLQWFSIMKENDLGTSLMLNMLKCSFLFVNCIYLIDFTVFKLINYQLLKIRFISIWITWIHRDKIANVCRVSRSEYSAQRSEKRAPGTEQRHRGWKVHIWGRKRNILGHMPNVVSSVTLNIFASIHPNIGNFRGSGDAQCRRSLAP